MIETAPIKVEAKIDDEVPVRVQMESAADPRIFPFSANSFPEKSPVMVNADDNMVREATTTLEQNLVQQGQRRVNLIWERTQSGIALMVTFCTVIMAVILVFRNETNLAVQLLSSAFFLIIGFYFGRSNHVNIGGAKGQNTYQGR